MRKEFIVERQGRSFVLYSGLLDMAHAAGLKSINTALVQIPAEANNRVAICAATIVLEKDGVERSFTGIGDAAPNNVAPAMQSCLIRMAETRAKARAMRDAVNVGVTAFEELGDDEGDEGHQSGGGSRATDIGRSTRLDRSPVVRAPRLEAEVAPSRAAGEVREGPARLAAVSPSAADPEGQGTKITDAQADAVRKLCSRRGSDPDALAAEKFGAPLADLSQAQASEFIRSLNDRSAANGKPALAKAA